ncbi:uncharacterized protein BBA_08467 [Beauveria bassiana ARSEF 2860]|uniref:Uncharacterized protein n=1 Tax=Beauveria bassiana (strain ARSEF 2860) TaxID=655819 RepID=J5JG43_BEAB2|nr:uncharacterized protein BBA_08467 [Beauveria bassiana ARSEF 2860]EJP62556.1 hypothetical protein BBA_08467 [Beauveria bassiana ARSEF 2860]
MLHDSLAGEGVTPELLLYVPVRRQDDCACAVKITAKGNDGDQGRGNKNRNEGVAETEPDSTLTRWSLAKECLDRATDGNMVRLAKRRDATATQLDDLLAAVILEALLGPLLARGADNMKDDLRTPLLESRMEPMEDRMARHVLVIQGLRRHKYNGPTLWGLGPSISEQRFSGYSACVK